MRAISLAPSVSKLLAVGLSGLITGCGAGVARDQPPVEPPADAAAPNPTAAAERPADAAAPPAPWRSDGTSSVIPILWVEVGGAAIGPTTEVSGRLRIIESHDGTLANPAALPGRPVSLDTAIGIKTRGNSTANHPKHSFAVELKDGAGAERNASVLGMPSESDWVFYACYNDKTCVRNALMYDLARVVYPRYAVRARYAEMFLDGQYHGLYMVVEKIKRDKNRVVMAVPPPDTAAGDITGGYIFRREGPGKSPAARNWTSKARTLYTFHYPRYDAITSAQKAYLIDYVDRFEAMMAGPDFAHPERGYRAWIDVPTWIDWALLQEFSKNIDAYKRSVYFVKQAKTDGDRLEMGPPWDFDLAFGLGGYEPIATPDGLAHVINGKLGPPENPPAFWPRIWTDPVFQEQARCRWRELRGGPLSDASVNAMVDRYLKYTAAAEKRDHARWPVIGVKLSPNFRTQPSYDDEVSYLRSFISTRLPWLDANLPGACPK
jgi:hypothetical protein